ncbi:MAG: hypothetical protein KDD67_02860 [Ignavibacteriae bacterium]|nr:hypothetical protein [Ignavibacteriota bacterium]MCB9216982.1 hypothetical protein [Ignavibacteria bacterium]
MYNEGDLVTLAFDGENYLLAKIILIEKLTLHDLTHLMIYDTLVEAGPEGYDQQGEYCSRTHELPDVSKLAIAVDHFALTSTAFEDSDPMAVGHEEVTGEELKGYAIWVALRRERAERRGMIRYEREGTDEESDEDYEGEEWEEDLLDEDELAEEVDEIVADVAESRAIDLDSEEDGSSTTEAEGDQHEVAEEEELVEVTAHTWHDTIFDIPIDQSLLELVDIFKGEEFNQGVVAGALIERVNADGEEIDQLVRSLIEEGDYGAGQDLLMYGDPAADKLNAELLRAEGDETVSDLLQILGDMGSDRAYKYIAEYFESRIEGVPNNPKAVAAARSFCYVVMLTGGTPEPLKSRLHLIERLDYPELREDAESAIAAIHSQGVEIPEDDPSSTSSDPFASM